MQLTIDFFLINLSALAAFLLRQNYGDFIVKQAPALYWPHYLSLLILLNLLYLAVFWLMGLYDRRQKRALLEEFILIFGTISVGVVFMLTLMFLGRFWWLSRIVLFSFYGIAIVLLCAIRLIGRKTLTKQTTKVDLSKQLAELKSKESALKNNVKGSLKIVIVTFNHEKQIIDCLESVQAVHPANLSKIVVVDNASSDQTVSLVLSRFPQVEVIKNPQNLGFSRAINLGFKSEKSDYTLILNPDIKVIPGSIEVLLNYAQLHAKVAIVGCRLLNDDGTLQYSARRFLDLRILLTRFTPLRGLMNGSAIERYFLMQDWDHQGNRLVDWVLGGCMLLKEAALKEIGLMDEDYFLYMDDVDFCWKAWDKGWQVAYVGEAVMFHKHLRASMNKLFNRATLLHYQSIITFLRKHALRLPDGCPSLLE